MKVKHLQQHKSDLLSALSRDLSEFERNFIFVSAGILAFSVSFIKDIIGENEIYGVEYLYIAWTLIVLSIGTMMYTFLRSADWSDKLFLTLDDFMRERELFNEEQSLSAEDIRSVKEMMRRETNRAKYQLKTFRYISVFLFAIGLFFLGLFTAKNFTSHKQSQKSASLTEEFFGGTIVTFFTKSK